MAKEAKRFEKVYSQGAMTNVEIWVDRETGVNYLFTSSGYAGGLKIKQFLLELEQKCR